VVERGPEKAGVGGSIPSLATILSITYVMHPKIPDRLSTRDWFLSCLEEAKAVARC
jgi:hypothetical protein